MEERTAKMSFELHCPYCGSILHKKDRFICNKGHGKYLCDRLGQIFFDPFMGRGFDEEVLNKNKAGNNVL